MGFVGALLIVALHTIPFPNNETEKIIIDFLFHKSGFLSASVPMFFGISGYLLVGHIDQPCWWHESIVKRIRTILIPFLTWTILFVTVKCFFQTLAYVLNIPSVTPNPSPNGVGWLAVELLGLDVFHQTGIVWYLRTLFLYVIVSPMFVFLAKKSSWLSVVAMVIMLFISRYSSNGVTHIALLDGFLAYTLYMEGLLAFYIGIFLRIHPLIFNFYSNISRCFIGISLIILIIGGGEWIFSQNADKDYGCLNHIYVV